MKPSNFDIIRWLAAVLFVSLGLCLSGQFADDFSGGDLSAWSGDVSDFVITDQEELQLNAQSESPSFLYVEPQIPRDALWEMEVRMTFNPSNSNGLEWILQSTTANPDELNGYGLRWGESGDADAVEFVRYDNGNATVLGRMREGAVANDPVQVRFQVVRLTDTFTIASAYDGEADFSDTLVVTDGTFGGGAQLVSGFKCNFTSTRSDRFFFDNVVIDRSRPDITPPVRRNMTVKVDQIDLLYSERIDIGEVEATLTPGNFSIDVELNGPDTLRLLLDPSLSPQTTYNLRIEGVSDLAGNIAPAEDIPLVFIETRPPEPFEIVINELMIAPGSETPLPEEEYIELYNRSEDYLELGGLFVLDETSMASISDFTLAPNNYIILCNTGDGDLFSFYGEVLEVSGLPTLRNSNDKIRLRDDQNRFIHGVDYTDSWYKDSNKDRGWSLELIDPDFACSEEAAYAASVGPLGGTPGQPNSLDASDFVDPLDPVLAQITADNEIAVQFNQWLPGDGLQADMLSLSPGQNDIEEVWVDMENPRNLRLELSNPVQTGQRYTLSLESGFLNCLQEPIDGGRSIQFGVPATPGPGDLLISEVMFNPNVGESQWVEIYNASDSVFDFTYLVLDIFKLSGQDRLTISQPNQILPGEYMVLTDNRNEVNDVYSAPFPLQTLEVDLPSLDRNEGQLQLWHIFGAEATLLDSSCYSDEWHSGFLRSERGVSLERMRWDVDGCVRNNWQSAAESEGYGTPTGPNSQQVAPPEGLSDGFQLLSPTFSPNSDGMEDLALIEYRHGNPDRPLPRITFSVYRPDGQLIRQIHNNFGLSGNTQLVWDGSQRDGLIAPEGFYLLHISSFDDEGGTGTWKGTVYLVR